MTRKQLGETTIKRTNPIARIFRVQLIGALERQITVDSLCVSAFEEVAHTFDTFSEDWKKISCLIVGD